MRCPLTLLELAEAWNTKLLASKPPSAGFHDPLTAGLAGESVHYAGMAGDLPLRLFEFKEFIQGNVQDVLRPGLMQFSEALLLFWGNIFVAESVSKSLPFRIRGIHRFWPGDNADPLAIGTPVKGESALAVIQVN